MIDEQRLTELLDEAANHYEPPARGPEAILAAVDGPLPPRRREWVGYRRNGALILAAAATVLAVTAVMDGDQLPGPAWSGKATTPAEVAGPAPEAADGGGSTASAGTGEALAGFGDLLEPESDVNTPAVDGALAEGATGGGKNVPALPARIVKTGALSLRVKDGAFEDAVDRLTLLATGRGGFVEKSTVSERDGNPTGGVTLRVPADAFESLLADAKGLGEVESVTTDGKDVTAEFVDLEARLRSATSARDQFSLLLIEATSIGDILSVQDRLNIVQREIEQLEGQRKVLEDQANLSTLTIELHEQGVNAELTTEPEPDGLGRAWADAREGFGNGIEAIVRNSGGLAIFLMCAAVALLAGRLGLRAWRHLRP